VKLARLLAFLAFCGAASAGMYDQPYGIVESGRANDVRKEMRLAISKIDGQTTRNPRRSDPVDPGKHTVTLHVETASGKFRPEFLDLELDVKPCTRYRIVASYRTTMGPDWKPAVYPERLGECRKKFMAKEAPAS
jgi:hypothetical protein